MTMDPGQDVELRDYPNHVSKEVRVVLREVEDLSVNVEYGRDCDPEDLGIMRKEATKAAKMNLAKQLEQFMHITDYNRVITAKIFLPYVRSHRVNTLKEQRDFWKNMYTEIADKQYELKQQIERLSRPFWKRWFCN